MDGKKVRYEGEAALQLLNGITKLYVIRGKKWVLVDLKKDRPSDEDLITQLLGPTGNLRAPTLRVRSTLVVGFHPEVYELVLK